MGQRHGLGRRREEREEQGRGTLVHRRDTSLAPRSREEVGQGVPRTRRIRTRAIASVRTAGRPRGRRREAPPTSTTRCDDTRSRTLGSLPHDSLPSTRRRSLARVANENPTGTRSRRSTLTPPTPIPRPTSLRARIQNDAAPDSSTTSRGTSRGGTRGWGGWEREDGRTTGAGVGVTAARTRWEGTAHLRWSRTTAVHHHPSTTRRSQASVTRTKDFRTITSSRTGAADPYPWVHQDRCRVSTSTLSGGQARREEGARRVRRIRARRDQCPTRVEGNTRTPEEEGGMDRHPSSNSSRYPPYISLPSPNPPTPRILAPTPLPPSPAPLQLYHIRTSHPRKLRGLAQVPSPPPRTAIYDHLPRRPPSILPPHTEQDSTRRRPIPGVPNCA